MSLWPSVTFRLQAALFQGKNLQKRAGKHGSGPILIFVVQRAYGQRGSSSGRSAPRVFHWPLGV